MPMQGSVAHWQSRGGTRRSALRCKVDAWTLWENQKRELDRIECLFFFGKLHDVLGKFGYGGGGMVQLNPIANCGMMSLQHRTVGGESEVEFQSDSITPCYT